MLATIGKKPLAEYRAIALQQQVEQRIKHHRQRQRRTDQQRCHQDKPADQAVAKHQGQPRHYQGQRRHPTLTPQPSRMRLMPGLRVGQGQQRQARRPPQTVATGEHGAQQAQANPAEPPHGTEAQLPRHFGAVQTTQAGGDIRQQHAGQQIAADDSGHATDQGQPAQFDREAGNQHPRADAASAHCPQQTSTLLQRQPDRGMHDKQPDHERQKTQRIEVQMKALGQARQIVFFSAAFELQLSLERLGQCRDEILGQQQARELIGQTENLLGKTDVHQQHAGGHVGLYMQGRQ
ncbi:hypothetical protein D3C87_1109180 [compost metagenome]